jgi:hypothetical protein
LITLWESSTAENGIHIFRVRFAHKYQDKPIITNVLQIEPHISYAIIIIINERYESIPVFWRFVQAAHKSLQSTNPQGMWSKVFSILSNIYDGSGRQNPEMSLIIGAEGRQSSSILRDQFNYGDLKPRGHYVSDRLIRFDILLP